MSSPLENKIFGLNNSDFEPLALEIFRYQASENEVYRKYIQLLRVETNSIHRISDIPFLPISFFKTHRVIVKGKNPQIVFESSGTTGHETSKHFVASTDLYRQSLTLGFRKFYGDPKQYCLLTLLPSYLERSNSSLVYMVSELIKLSKNPQSGFFLNNIDELAGLLKEQEEKNQPTILIGVTFALLEMAKRYQLDLKKTIVMETGGMKGRGKEMLRSEVHRILKDALGIDAVHSEYGMTELLSQAYSAGNGIFECPSWMKVFARDPYDPKSILPNGRAGALNIIDLSNIYSCSFVQTDDIGVVHPIGSFEVLGRMDGSQIRGCNLLVTA